MSTVTKAHCDEHAEFRRGCGPCNVLEFEAQRARDFPEALVGPWQEKVLRTLGEGWRGYMQPLTFSDGRVVWTLRFSGKVGAVGFDVGFSGSDQDAVLFAAQAYRAPWWSLESST